MDYYFITVLLSLAVSLCAYVYSGVLTEPGMILSPWYQFLEARIKNRMLFKVLIGCTRCVAGQMSLWFYLIAFWAEYNLFQHVFFVCFAIYNVSTFNKFYRWRE